MRTFILTGRVFMLLATLTAAGLAFAKMERLADHGQTDDSLFWAMLLCLFLAAYAAARLIRTVKEAR